MVGDLNGANVASHINSFRHDFNSVINTIYSLSKFVVDNREKFDEFISVNPGCFTEEYKEQYPIDLNDINENYEDDDFTSINQSIHNFITYFSGFACEFCSPNLSRYGFRHLDTHIHRNYR